MRAVVVGAGIAGLSAAHELGKRGVQVTVLEASDQAGGRMANRMVAGFQNFTGATGLLPCAGHALALTRELGLEASLVAFPEYGLGSAMRRGGPYSIEMRLRPLQLLFNSPISWRSRLRLAKLLPDWLRAKHGTDPDFVSTAAAFDDESLADYLVRLVGRDFLEFCVTPIFRSLWAWNVEETSRGYFLGLMPHLAVDGASGYSFSQGIGALTQALAAKLDVRLDAHVEGIGTRRDGSRRFVRYRHGGESAEIEADVVVCAVPGNAVAGIVENQAGWEADFFAEVPYAQYAMVTFLLKQDVGLGGVYHARDMRSAICFHKYFPENRDVVGQPSRLWVALAPDRQRHLLDKDGGNLVEVALGEMRRIDRDIDAKVVDAVPQRDGYVIAKFPVGQIRRVRSFLSVQNAGPKTLYYVGDYLSNATAGGACASGRTTAWRILEHWS
jgi:oxygen-dependent protoporphyrinogen oxidase